jgi:GDP-4-dehydro-6-deoxy-D-mannose reductase
MEAADSAEEDIPRSFELLAGKSLILAMADKKVFITGATGFVGRHLIRHLASAKKPRYKIFGSCYPERPEHCIDLCAQFPALELLHLDLRSAESVADAVKSVKPDWIFHLAAVSQVRLSWENRRETIETNLMGTFDLYEALRQYSPKTRVLFISSSDVYGCLTPKGRVFREDDRGCAVSPYAFSKISGEILSEFYAAAEKLDIVIARSFPHTGPGQSADFVCADWARQIALIEKQPGSRSGNRSSVIQVGNLAIRRDFSDVRDVIRAYRLLLEKGRRGEIYNVCSGRAPSLQTILDILLSLSPSKIEVQVDPAKIRKTDIPYLAGSLRKISQETDWRPRFDLKKTLGDLLDDWRSKV